MRKTRTSNGYGDDTVFSELYYGVYVTADDGVALINYLMHPLSKNDTIVEIGVEEELNERENGRNLDDYGDHEQ